MRPLFVVLRVAVAVAITVAIIAQLSESLGFWRESGITDPTIQVVNFFSFFTIESNIASAVVLVIGAVQLIMRSRPDSAGYTLARASVTTYMVVTGLVYNLLLRGIELPQGSTVGWSNEILHVVAPVYLLVDWLFAPGRSAIAARTIWFVLVYPIVWVGYTLIRGPFVTDAIFGNDFWYPYPFLNPVTSADGYLSVAIYVVVIAAAIALVAAAVLWVSRRGQTAESRLTR
ncbi:Pr6Pr family membrane protein [Conyzicola sp.]|uniref:Pr6Pr family membrane protein n=1 Tax=Conyzicola sp. TaxID=1969404 RepID=UPI003988E57B